MADPTTPPASTGADSAESSDPLSTDSLSTDPRVDPMAAPGLDHVREMWRLDGASAALGITATSVELTDSPIADGRPLGRATTRMRITEAMVNGHGICHGGYMFLLADSTFALACNASGRPTVAAGCDIDYLEPVRLDDVLLAHGAERLVRGRSGITDVTLTRESDGAVVAEFRGRSRSLRS